MRVVLYFQFGAELFTSQIMATSSINNNLACLAIPYISLGLKQIKALLIRTASNL
jgi:hypothetical protein